MLSWRLLILFLFTACFSPEREMEVESRAPNPTPESEEDCIFNNDYQGLTTAWLEQLNLDNYSWDAEAKLATIGSVSDTIYASQGGCVHFTILARRRYFNSNHLFQDKAFLISASKELATIFDLKNILVPIQNRAFTFEMEEPDKAWLLIEDDKPEDNLFYEGVEFTRTDNYVEVSILQNYN